MLDFGANEHLAAPAVVRDGKFTRNGHDFLLAAALWRIEETAAGKRVVEVKLSKCRRNC
ncbi:MAG: hypothetical protein GX594_15705 [Pirellulaceae bacterium]|nr:hypothetical protein [Pirellulaceae bacterium]